MHTSPQPPPSAKSLIEAFNSNPPSTKPYLLDLNPSLIYTQSHSLHSTNIPYSTLRHRFHELPQPPCTLLILVKRRHLSNVVDLLRSKGYTTVPLFYHPGVMVSGSASRALWRPAPIVQSFVNAFKVAGTLALDIACGCGRDAKFLTLHGFNVTAVDRDTNLLTKARNLYNSNYYNPSWTTSSTGSLTTIQRTFGTDRNDDVQFLRSKAANLVIVVRFLRRGVLEHLHEAVAPGGYIVYEHFLQGCENFGGPMKKSQMLNRGELRKVFSSERGFIILREDEQRLDDGRPITRFIARRLETA